MASFDDIAYDIDTQPKSYDLSDLEVSNFNSKSQLSSQVEVNTISLIQSNDTANIESTVKWQSVYGANRPIYLEFLKIYQNSKGDIYSSGLGYLDRIEANRQKIASGGVLIKGNMITKNPTGHIYFNYNQTLKILTMNGLNSNDAIDIMMSELNTRNDISSKVLDSNHKLVFNADIYYANEYYRLDSDSLEIATYTHNVKDAADYKTYRKYNPDNRTRDNTDYTSNSDYIMIEKSQYKRKDVFDLSK